MFQRLFTDTEMCTHAVVSQRGEINKDKREQRGESTGRDNAHLYLAIIMSGYVSYDLHVVEEERRWSRLDDLRGSRLIR